MSSYLTLRSSGEEMRDARNDWYEEQLSKDDRAVSPAAHEKMQGDLDKYNEARDAAVKQGDQAAKDTLN